MVRVVSSEKMPSARSVWLSRAVAASRLPLQMVVAVWVMVCQQPLVMYQLGGVVVAIGRRNRP